MYDWSSWMSWKNYNSRDVGLCLGRDDKKGSLQKEETFERRLKRSERPNLSRVSQSLLAQASDAISQENRPFGYVDIMFSYILPFNKNEAVSSGTKISTNYNYVKSISGERPYKCKDCNLTFARLECFQKHTHSEERKFLCSLCGKTFGRKSARDLHERAHRGDRRYACGFCTKMFMTNQVWDLP